MSASGRRAVCLCVNHDRAYVALAYQAIESIRRFNPDIPVVFFVAEGIASSVLRYFTFSGLRLMSIGSTHPKRYLMKWDCVGKMADLPYDQVCFLDVDTICFRDIAELFEHCGEVDFAARREPQTMEDVGDCQVDWGKYRTMLARHYADERMVFNVGAMVMSTRFTSFLRDQRFFLTRLTEEYAAEPALYPARNRHIVDQFCLSIMLGTRPDLETRAISPDIVPFFAEFSLLGKTDPGVVMHYWNQFAHLKSPNPYADADGSRPASDPGGVLP